MSGRVRTAARWGALATLALLLTGCLKLNMNLGINSDNTVSGTIQFGVQKELLELSGQSPEDLLGTESPFPSDAPGVTVTPFDDGEFAGQEFTFESLPLEQFNSQQDSDALNIQRQGDRFVVTGVLDLSSGLSGATGAFGPTGQQLFEGADIRISITFPGDVIDAPGGQIDGNTVTYVPTFGERLEISATGSAIDDGDAGDVVGGGGDSNLMLILIIVGAVLAVLIVAFLVMRSRRGSSGGGATGFGEPGPAAMQGTPVPPAAQPGPPGAPMPPAAPPMPPAAPPPPPSEG